MTTQTDEWIPPPIVPISQTILYSIEGEQQGIIGNCLQASLASALGLPLDAVPNFASFLWWPSAVRLWLRGRQLDWCLVSEIPAGRSIVVGRTIRNTGRDHAVVGDNGHVTWDPHPSHAGLVTVKHAYVLERWPNPERPGPAVCILCGKT